MQRRKNMRKGRLFQLLCHLLEKGQSTAGIIAEEFGVSVRTVYRDVETLNAAGIPIYAETGRHGGICLMKGLVMDRAVLSQEDRRKILDALKSGGEDSLEPIPASLQKLAELFDLPADEWLEPGFQGQAPGPNDRIEFLRRAIIQHHTVVLTMADSAERLYRVHTMPLQVCCREEGWFLRAYCPEEGKYRLLPLSHILKWKPTVESFEPMSFPEEAPKEEAPTARVVVRFPAGMVDQVFAAFDCTNIHRRKDGDLELRRDMPVDQALVNKLLALGPEAGISSPPELRQQVAERARAIYEANL